jgi:hypothetical protein
MLDVVIERTIDVGDIAERHRYERKPVIVKLPAGPIRERQCPLDHAATKQARGAGDRVQDQQRGEVVVVAAAPLPQRFRTHETRGIDPPEVTVGELGRAYRLPERLELVRIPAIVMIAEGDELGLRRDHPQDPLEVSVKAEVLVRARNDEATVSGDLLPDPLEPVQPRMVVADQADPIPVGLGANRLDLSVKELEVRIEGRHADRDQGFVTGSRQALISRRLGRVHDGDRAQ